MLAYLPSVAYTTVTDALIAFLLPLTVSSTWNVLAGYAGPVEQQVYLGLGAYAVLQLSDWEVQPFVGVLLAAVVRALIAVPASLLAFRLRGDYFAVGTWAIAEVYRLVIVWGSALGGGSGRWLTTLSTLGQAIREAFTYPVALAIAVLRVLAGHLLIRGRLGLALTAVGDNEVAGSSAGVDVWRAKGAVYLVSAVGTGAASRSGF
jgi:branched-chain amino acid transport system permease protein